jgi:hypothetical protein
MMIGYQRLEARQSHCNTHIDFIYISVAFFLLTVTGEANIRRVEDAKNTCRYTNYCNPLHNDSFVLIFVLFLWATSGQKKPKE